MPEVDRSVMRAAMSELVAWLKSDLFEEVRDHPPGHRAFVNPAGIKVVCKPRDDLRGVGGWIEGPDGKALVVTSWLDTHTLIEYIP
jgi:hypothetical protein